MRYDIIYIGGGLNYAGAIVAAKAGKKVLLIERDLQRLGGTCLHSGCIPSKYLLHYAQTQLDLRDAAFRVHKDRLKMEQLHTTIDAVLERATSAIARQLEYAKVTVVEGEGRIVAPYTVEAASKRYRGAQIVIGTGSRPIVPEGCTYDGKRVITSDEALRLEELPATLMILGAGAIGLEFASFFAANATQVSLFLRHDTLLHYAHPEISRALMRTLEEIGVRFITDTPIDRIYIEGETVVAEAAAKRWKFDRALIATGRAPATEAVMTDEIALNRGIVTDAHFETTLPDHYAIGDCNGKLQLAHAARAEVLYVTRRLLGMHPKPVRIERIPKFIHTLPMSYAQVGWTRQTLHKRGIDFSESLFRLSSLTLSGVYGATGGMVVLYADREGFLLGGEILAPNAEELIAIVSVALAGEMDRETMMEAIFAHPTFSEGVGRALAHL